MHAATRVAMAARGSRNSRAASALRAVGHRAVRLATASRPCAGCAGGFGPCACVAFVMMNITVYNLRVSKYYYIF